MAFSLDLRWPFEKTVDPWLTNAFHISLQATGLFLSLMCENFTIRLGHCHPLIIKTKVHLNSNFPDTNKWLIIKRSVSQSCTTLCKLHVSSFISKCIKNVKVHCKLTAWNADKQTPAHPTNIVTSIYFYVKGITHGGVYIYIKLRILPLCTEPWNDTSCISISWY